MNFEEKKQQLIDYLQNRYSFITPYEIGDIMEKIMELTLSQPKVKGLRATKFESISKITYTYNSYPLGYTRVVEYYKKSGKICIKNRLRGTEWVFETLENAERYVNNEFEVYILESLE